MVHTWELTIPKLSGDKTRRGYVWLPEDYAKFPKRRYPVLYMFDGHNVFFDSHATYGKSWGMAEYLKKSKKQLIVVAVDAPEWPAGGGVTPQRSDQPPPAPSDPVAGEPEEGRIAFRPCPSRRLCRRRRHSTTQGPAAACSLVVSSLLCACLACGDGFALASRWLTFG